MEPQNDIVVCYKQTYEEDWDTVRQYVHVEAKYWYGWKEDHWIKWTYVIDLMYSRNY